MAKRSSSDFALLARYIMTGKAGVTIHSDDSAKPEKAKVKISPEGKQVVKRLEAVIDDIESIIEYINCDVAPIVLRMDKAIKQLMKAKALAR